MKRIGVAGAVVAAVLGLAGPATAQTGVVTQGELSQVQVGDTRAEVESVFGATGSPWLAKTNAAGTHFAVFLYPARGRHSVVVVYREKVDQVAFHLRDKFWCTDGACVEVNG
jgi:outer membrane protein assembly factor BamE (lipoprotein component of BamABCDE complex)